MLLQNNKPLARMSLFRTSSSFNTMFELLPMMNKAIGIKSFQRASSSRASFVGGLCYQKNLPRIQRVHLSYHANYDIRGISMIRPIYSDTFHQDWYSRKSFSAVGYNSNDEILGAVSDGQSSKHETSHTKVGHVTRQLRVLDMDTVKTILDELRSVDADSNERLDTEELKNLLRKHKNVFTEDEIIEIGELFYAGKSGGSVSFSRFVEAIDRVAQLESRADIVRDKVGNPLDLGTCGNEYLFYNNRSNYTKEEVENVTMTHLQPETFRDRLAFNAVKVVRKLFDVATGWSTGSITKDKVLNRTIFLETVAAVPGMVAAIVRHFRSLRRMERDGGMMQMFLDEANNERMHLLTFVRMKDPNWMFRAAVIGGQVGFGSFFLLAYVISPRFCHRFVGYIEEEAVTTYTKIIHAIETAPDESELAKWKSERAPRIALSYWKLGENGTILDVIYAVRADEAEHRDVNHICSDMKEGQPNPVSNTEQKLNTMLLRYVRDMMERDINKELTSTYR